MPAIIPFLTGVAGTAGAGLATAAPAIGGAVGLSQLYNNYITAPEQARQQLTIQKEALAKQNMSQFLRNQILRQQAGQFQNMVQGYGQPDFLKQFLSINPNQRGGSYGN